MHDRVEVLLQVDAFGQTVGGDEHPVRMLGQRGHGRFAFVRCQPARHGLHLGALQDFLQVAGDVLGGGDEAAKNDRSQAELQQPAQLRRQLLELAVLRASQRLGALGQQQQPAGGGVGVAFGLRAGRQVQRLTVVLGRVEHHLTAQPFDHAPVGLVGHHRPRPQGGRRRLRTARQRAQQAQRRPPADPLPVVGLTGDLDALPGVREHVLEQPGILGMQAVRHLGVLARREGRVLTQVRVDVRPSALHQEPGERRPGTVAAAAGQVQRRELAVQQLQQTAEGVFLAAVRRGRHQHQVPFRIRREFFQQPVTLVAFAADRVTFGAGVRLVDDHELRGLPQELRPPAVLLDEVQADHHVPVPLEQALPGVAVPLQAPHRRGQHRRGFQAELHAQLGDPLLDQVRRAQHRHPADLAAVEQLPGDQGRLDGLADAHVVGNHQSHGGHAQRHQQRHQLVRARLDAQPPERAERPGAAANRQPRGVQQQPRGGRVTVTGGVRRREGRRAHRLTAVPDEDAGHLRVTAAERLEQQEVVGAVRQHHPFTSSHADHRADIKVHASPNRNEYCRATAGQVEGSWVKLTTV